MTALLLVGLVALGIWGVATIVSGVASAAEAREDGGGWLFWPLEQITFDDVPARAWTGIVVHHSESPLTTTVTDIHRWHQERGWKGIGYHLVIDGHGRIWTARPLDEVGAHAKGRNATHIGICVIGRDEFTAAQEDALQRLVLALKERFDIRTVERHHERCPGQALEVERITGTRYAAR